MKIIYKIVVGRKSGEYELIGPGHMGAGYDALYKIANSVAELMDYVSKLEHNRHRSIPIGVYHE